MFHVRIDSVRLKAMRILFYVTVMWVLAIALCVLGAVLMIKEI